MTSEEIEKELIFFEGEVYFTSLLPSFVWSQGLKKVVDYTTQTDKTNQLIVLETQPIDLGSKTLSSYFKSEEITEEDVVVFCVNEEFYPKTKGNWIRIKVIKKINKKKNDVKRIPKEHTKDASKSWE